MSILVLGATGLLGNAMFRVLSQSSNQQVFGTIRQVEARQFFTPALGSRLLVVDNLEAQGNLKALFDLVQPSVVVNCMALRESSQRDPMALIAMFSIFPRDLAHLCQSRGARLVQISSDGVFRGTRGGYTENDLPDATDCYGLAKRLGEIDQPGSITLRTSIIGHEIGSQKGLLEWFLSQNEECRCYTQAIYSGFPSVVLAQIICDQILPRPELHGIYHLATRPISKFELLVLVAKQYKKLINIVPDDSVVIDRSLSAVKFACATGYVPPEWPILINMMYSNKFGLKES